METEDILPKSICQQCMSDLHHTYQFIRKCQKSEQLLQSTLIYNNKEDTKTINIERIEIENNIPDEECKMQFEECNLEDNYVKPESLSIINVEIAKGESADEFPTEEGADSKPVIKYPEHIQIHKTIRVKTKEYVCNVCKKSFTKHGDLIVHEMVHQLRCKICLKSFTKRATLIAHSRNHSEKRFICKLCGNSFHQARNLKSHQKTHDGGKSHWCKICGKRFRVKNFLILHENVQHGDKNKALVKEKLTGQ